MRAAQSARVFGDANWQHVRLSEVAAIDRQAVKPGEISGQELYVGLENITGGGEFEGVITAAKAVLKSNKFVFTEDHVLYGKLRPYLAKIAAPDFPGICSTDVLPIRPGRDLDRRYLLHYLRTPRMVAHAKSSAVGINLPRLSPRVLESFEVPLPPIDEQKRIAAVLDATEALRTKRRLALARLGTLTQAIFIDMFGDPVGNPRGWPVDALTRLGNLDRGVSRHRPRNDPVLLGGDWPLIQTGDVGASGGYITEFTTTYSEVGLAQSKIWPVGTLCITIAANIAKTGILTFEACFPDSVVGFTAGTNGATEYVRCFLNSLQPVLEKQAPESAQKNINLKILRELQVPIPPEELMVRFTERASEVNALSLGGIQQQEGLDALFASLQQRAFRGEL